MSKFKVGDIVEIVNRNYEHAGQQFAVESMAKTWQPTFDGSGIVVPVYRLMSINSVTFRAEDLVLVSATCLVCNKAVVVKENIIQEHEFENKICYGSYLPKHATPYKEKCPLNYSNQNYLDPL